MGTAPTRATNEHTGQRRAAELEQGQHMQGRRHARTGELKVAVNYLDVDPILQLDHWNRGSVAVVLHCISAISVRPEIDGAVKGRLNLACMSDR